MRHGSSSVALGDACLHIRWPLLPHSLHQQVGAGGRRNGLGIAPPLVSSFESEEDAETGRDEIWELLLPATICIHLLPYTVNSLNSICVKFLLHRPSGFWHPALAKRTASLVSLAATHGDPQPPAATRGRTGAVPFAAPWKCQGGDPAERLALDIDPQKKAQRQSMALTIWLGHSW